MTPHLQMKGKYKTLFYQLSSFVWVEELEPCAVSPQNSLRKNQLVLALLALAIWSLRKDTAFACGSLQILCASYTEEQDPSVILCCLTSHSAVRLYTLYAHGLKNSNIHPPGKLLVLWNEEHLFFLTSEASFSQYLFTCWSGNLLCEPVSLLSEAVLYTSISFGLYWIGLICL